MKPHDWGFHTIRIWKQSIGSPKQNGLIKNKYQGWLWPQFEGDSPLRWIDSDWNQTYLHQYFQKGGNRALIISHTYLRRHYDGIMNLQILHSFPNIQCLLLCQYFNFLRARHYCILHSDNFILHKLNSVAKTKKIKLGLGSNTLNQWTTDSNTATMIISIDTFLLQWQCKF